jgi:hypothetical protein
MRGGMAVLFRMGLKGGERVECRGFMLSVYDNALCLGNFQEIIRHAFISSCVHLDQYSGK